MAVALLLLVLGNAARIARMIRMRRLQAHPERSPDQAAAMWYERMARYPGAPWSAENHDPDGAGICQRHRR